MMMIYKPCIEVTTIFVHLLVLSSFVIEAIDLNSRGRNRGLSIGGAVTKSTRRRQFKFGTTKPDDQEEKKVYKS